MSTVQELAEGLRQRGETISGLRCYPVMHPKPEPPALCVNGPVRWTYDETFEGYWRPVFELWILVNPADLYRGEQALHSYLAPSGPRSIPAAVNGDPSLGGVADSTRLLGGSRPPAVVETAGGQLLGAAIEVEVLAM